MTNEAVALFEQLRAVGVQRLRARARFHRVKERESLQGTSDSWRLKAEEADACADVLLSLKPDYIAPDEPIRRGSA